MDVNEPSNDVPEEVARELLIAISDCLPDEVSTKDVVPKDVVPEAIGVESGISLTNTTGDGADKYRFELISISNNQFPDASVSPQPKAS